jgi:hypothetical protein
MHEEDCGMSLELYNEAVKINRTIGEDSTQVVFENDIIVPDIKPDISRILLLDGEAQVNSSEVRQDGLLIKGVICYKIIYVSDESEQMLKSINTNAPFSCSLDIPGAQPGMNGCGKCSVDHMEYDITNSRKINIRAIAGVSGKVTQVAEENVACDAGGVEGLQMLKSKVNVNSFAGSEETIVTIKEIIEVPAGKPSFIEVLRNDIRITGKEYRPEDGRVAVNGLLNIMTLYTGDEENGSNIQTMDHELPFSGVINLPEVNENSICNVEFITKENSFEPTEDSDGELRLMDCEVIIAIKAEAYGRKEIMTIDDAYSTAERIQADMETVILEEYLEESRSQVVVRDVISLQEGIPDIAEVFNLLSRPVISGTVVNDGRVDIEGVLENNVLYLANSEESPVNCLDNETPFSHSIDNKNIKAGMGCECNVEIDNCSYSLLSSNEVEIRISISIVTKMIRPVSFNSVKSLIQLPAVENEERPSIILYFVQKGDTLWKIAKRYSTTIEVIQRSNDIEDISSLRIGEQLVIPWNRG